MDLCVLCCLQPGHNCFGAVLYPITMADFVIADVTDAMLDGIVHATSVAVGGRVALVM